MKVALELTKNKSPEFCIEQKTKQKNQHYNLTMNSVHPLTLTVSPWVGGARGRGGGGHGDDADDLKSCPVRCGTQTTQLPGNSKQLLCILHVS